MPSMDHGPGRYKDTADVSALSAQQLTALVKKWEELDFPEAFSNFDRQGKWRLPPEAIFKAGKQIWAAFNPSDYFRGPQPIFTPQIVKELQSGALLLSVGAGPAYTERLLVRRLRVPAPNIFLSDLHREVLPCEFSRFGFDMHDPWPPLGAKKFDYIVFLESAPFSKYRHRTRVTAEAEIQGRTQAFCDAIRNAVSSLAPGGQIRMSIGVMVNMPLNESITALLMSDFPRARLDVEQGCSIVFSVPE